MLNLLYQLGLRLGIYERGAAGVPSTTQPVLDIAMVIDSYSHTIDHHIGFETMTTSFPCTLEDALDWLANGLMRSALVSGPDAEPVWEGFLETIEAQIGDEVRSVSVRDMANRVRVRYTNVLGEPDTIATASDTASQALYGTKDTVLALNESDSTEAGHFQIVMLARLKNPIAGPSATAQSGGGSGEVRLTLHFAGWYTTLDWVLTSDTSTTKTSTTTQVGTLLGDIAAINAFIATVTANIVSSGITAVEYIEQDSSYRQKIESLLGRGNGANPYAWGVYEDRTFHADVWAGATPDTITYQRHIGESVVRDSAGGIVAPWNVRPDAMYQVVELLDVAPVSGAKDSAARFYVGRVTCTIGDGSIALTLEPSEPSDLSAILVTKYVG
jgi:hypothetical protein